MLDRYMQDVGDSAAFESCQYLNEPLDKPSLEIAEACSSKALAVFTYLRLAWCFNAMLVNQERVVHLFEL